ncbi:hypothetical protein SAMD00019534_022450 [Acytostelium subglobosum LB1]|uniref:hypothetical protein n=1 Tax=Acytostelium subglobosum LB1 TaxID=1410327 RepID=UPI000644AA7B|nr:hypothetical protein SAMD00019534_022450 [Acytostelium subglobosum LB1]GAM19070.1 hypothetical protein SAMD00019534_022450 [Acytostelium subglobosum LB1]|eukprot:XP_012756997.1 hypothetical protein SAMD00019534_022450 [Acytostelium subglobosum LB1]
MITLFEFVALTVVVILLPLLTDLLNGLFPNARIGRIAQKLVGHVLVTFITALILVALYLWYSTYFPYFLDTYRLDHTSPHFHLHCIITFILIANVLIYYLYAINTSSYIKQHPIQSQDDDSVVATTTTHTSATAATDATQQPQCKQCGAMKRSEQKSYHCRICKRCTHHMDHHCPFIANCVGTRNHCHFVNFLMYTTLGVFYAMYLSWLPYRDCILMSSTSATCQHLSKHSYIFLCTVLLLAPIAAILTWQFYVIVTDTMTVEILKRFKGLRFTQWIPYLWHNFQKRRSMANISRVFPGWRLYNIVVPFI